MTREIPQRKPGPFAIAMATVVLVAILWAIGVALGYLAALLVIKVGLPAGPAAGLPIIAVLVLAWGFSGEREAREVAITIVFLALFSGVLFAAVEPRSPFALLAQKTLPPFGAVSALASLLASLSLLLCAAVRPFYDSRKK